MVVLLSDRNRISRKATDRDTLMCQTRGISNCRGVGGWTTTGGMSIASGVVYRCAAPTEVGLSEGLRLKSAGAVARLDLGSSLERVVTPCPDILDMPVKRCDILTGRPGAASLGAGGRLSGLRDELDLAIDSSGRLCEPLPTPTAQSWCIARAEGSERGCWCAVLLGLLGVPRGLIEADDLTTNALMGTSLSDLVDGCNLGCLNISFDAAAVGYVRGLKGLHSYA